MLDLAAASYTRRLHEPQGRDALAYLHGRGLSDETIRRFGLGWAGDGRGSLVAELARSDVDPARMAEAGLLQSREDGTARELFYNRVMFPIRDRRGRTISFGGRALGDAKPKYINGPETAIYSKGRTLYALDLAREGARRSRHGVIVAEGYMDVIALHQAGFGGAVAPLGTALTASQLEELWRVSDAPTLCFDGDAAGARAAARAAELALPLIAPDRTLCLATLPPGEDPDTLVRRAGLRRSKPCSGTSGPWRTPCSTFCAKVSPQTRRKHAPAYATDWMQPRPGSPTRGWPAIYRTALRERLLRRHPQVRGQGGGAGILRHVRRPGCPLGAEAATAERHRAFFNCWPSC